MIIADVTFYPIGKGVSAGRTIKRAINRLRESGLKCYPNSMATVIEAGTLAELFAAISETEAFIVSEGFERVETIIKIDHRLDVDNNVQRKLRSIGED